MDRTELDILMLAINGLRGEVKADIAELRTEVKADIANLGKELRTEFRSELQGIKTELKVIREQTANTVVQVADHAVRIRNLEDPQL